MKKILISLSIIFICSTIAGAGVTSLGIVNGDFESGSLSGWTLSSGAAWDAVNTKIGSSPAAAQSGSWFASASGAGTSAPGTIVTNIYQSIDLSAYAADIAAGNAKISVSGYAFGEVPGMDDYAFMRLISDTGPSTDSATTNQREVWSPLGISDWQIPTGTTSVSVILLAGKTSGNYIDAGFDNITGSIYVTDNEIDPPQPSNGVPAPGALLLGSLGISIVGWMRKRRSL